MKTKLFFFVILLALGFVSSSVAQSVKRISPDTIDPIIVDLSYSQTQTRAEVSAIDALLIINHLKGTAEIEFVEVAGANNSRLNPIGKDCFSDSGRKITICFKNLDDGTTAAGRQKNRRVEMTIEFD